MWSVKIYYTRLVFLLIVSLSRVRIGLVFLTKINSIFLEWVLSLTNSCYLRITLIFDWISLLFLGFVAFISSIVIIYRGRYISKDNNISRFIYLVLGFVISIGMLIIRPNLVRLLLGWDGLGLISYLLVIYYQNEKSARAGILTVLSNRVGDVAILLRIAFFFRKGRWNLIFYNREIRFYYITILSFLLVLAGMTKRAQIPFSAWLPAAIAAPTPVSALVHSSTLVTAGVYLIIRVNPFLSKRVEVVLLILARLTIFIAGVGANFEYDLKKIIALSTLRQLGVIIGILALGRLDLAFFHLLNHALFKALLFLCAGRIIHRVKDNQDIRFIGRLIKQIPLTIICINLANLSLCGFPFLAGFYSKDLILEIIFISNINIIIFLLFVFRVGITVCYRFRLVYYTFSRVSNLSSLSGIKDNRGKITYPILGLARGAVLGGARLSWLIFPYPDIICIRVLIKFLTLLVRILGAVFGYMLSLITTTEQIKVFFLYFIVVCFGSIWFIPYLSTININKYIFKVGEQVIKVGDLGWSEFYGGQGAYSIFFSSALNLQVIQDNRIKLYMLSFFLVLVILIISFI